MISLVRNVVTAAMRMAAFILAGSLLQIPTGASFEFHVSAQKGSWLIPCSHCLSSFCPWTSLDFPWKQSPTCCFPFPTCQVSFSQPPDVQNSQCSALCERDGSLEMEELRSPELLQGAAGATGHPDGQQHRPLLSHRWHLSHQDYLKVHVPHG